jgi:hypothetical protein
MSEIEGRVKYLPEDEKEKFGVNDDEDKADEEKKAADDHDPAVKDESLADKVRDAAHNVKKRLAT